MNFHIITIFPEALENYFDSSVLKRAREKKMLNIKFYNPRDYTKDKHKKIDDSPFGGGPGMVMKVDVIVQAVLNVLNEIKKTNRTKIILLSPDGKQFTQKMARNLAKKNKDIILISGRYEGIDARVKKILRAEKISIGPYVLTGGELPAGVIVDAISRHVPGVLGKKESLEDERGIGIPVYTRPEIFEFKGKKYRVPKVLLSGNHKKIEEWRKKHAK